MNRNSKIILLFVSTGISLLIILMSFYGIDRYLTLYSTSTGKYLKKYNFLSKPSGKDKVLISFSTTQDKLKKIKPMMNSVLDQTVKVDSVNMNLPPKKENYIIPREYKDICNINYLGKDYGQCNSIIPTLLTTKDKGTKIIYLKDDIVYGKDFLEQIINESNKYPNNAITAHKNNEVYATLVKPEFFSVDVIDNNKKYFDESWITSHLINPPKELKYIENYKKL